MKAFLVGCAVWGTMLICMVCVTALAGDVLDLWCATCALHGDWEGAFSPHKPAGMHITISGEGAWPPVKTVWCREQSGTLFKGIAGAALIASWITFLVIAATLLFHRR